MIDFGFEILYSVQEGNIGCNVSINIVQKEAQGI